MLPLQEHSDFQFGDLPVEGRGILAQKHREVCVSSRETRRPAGQWYGASEGSVVLSPKRCKANKASDSIFQTYNFT